MKTCVGCKYAQWKTTVSGRLHPSGDGKCEYPYKVPELPASMYWSVYYPSPYGGDINRHKEVKDRVIEFSCDTYGPSPCVYWSCDLIL